MVQYDRTGAMASNVCTVLKTQASTESNRHGTNVLIVKGTAHTRLKEIHAKATVIALASFDVPSLHRESTDSLLLHSRTPLWFG